VNDYYQFKVSTLGYEDIKLVWDQMGSSTGPKDFKLLFSVDGVAFNEAPTFSTYTVAGSFTNFVADLTTLSVIERQNEVFFRLADMSTSAIGGGTVGTAGTGRVDNVTVSAVPEPATAGLLFGGFGMLMAARRRG
jgi:hypothetical protein